MCADDAVREFHRKFEKKTSHGMEDARDSQRNLERYVGRRPDEPLTIKDQVERFPFLKNAPVEGDYASSVKVNFKPVGRQLRNVRCLRCGEWGHVSGDRECPLKDSNPNDAARQLREDPMTHMMQLHAERKQGLVLKKSAMPLEMVRCDQEEGLQAAATDCGPGCSKERAIKERSMRFCCRMVRGDCWRM